MRSTNKGNGHLFPYLCKSPVSIVHSVFLSYDVCGNSFADLTSSLFAVQRFKSKRPLPESATWELTVDVSHSSLKRVISAVREISGPDVRVEMRDDTEEEEEEV